jgi:predicted DNA-binding ribbon-helix-helix protein
MAGEMVDRFTDETAPVEEQQKRKRKLIHGPANSATCGRISIVWARIRLGAESQAMTPRPKRKSKNAKRSVVIGQQKTSIGLEDAFWFSLKDVAAKEGIPVSQLVSRINADRQHANLSSAVRLYLLNYYRRLAEQKRQ